jgi:hypothetical protein
VSGARGREVTGALLIVLGAALIVGSLALHAWGGSASVSSVGAAPPLSPAELTTLAHDRSAVTSLPQALAEVPSAMVDAARSSAGSPLTRTSASELLFEHPELGALLRAIERPGATTTPLSSLLSTSTPRRGPPLLSTGAVVVVFVLPGLMLIALGLVLRSRRGARWVTWGVPATCLAAGALLVVGLLVPDDGGTAPIHALGGVAAAAPSPVSAGDVQTALSTLEQVYDDVVPALQIAGAAGRVVLDPQSAVAVLSTDHHLGALDDFVTNFTALYGVGVLVTQQAASRADGSDAPHAARGLAWLGLLAGLVLLLAGGASATRRVTRRPLATAAADQPAPAPASGSPVTAGSLS